MGKTIVSQARGKGGPRYRAPSHRYKARVKYRKNDDLEKNILHGKVMDIIHCPGHTAPLAKVLYENGEKSFIFAPEKIKVNDEISSGSNSTIKPGNTLSLKNIPEGTLIYNIESMPGDGGKFVRAAGTFAKILSNIKDRIVIELPSKKQKIFNPECRATIGIIAGSGRTDKPFVKAGKRHYAMKARNKLYPITSGVAMNAVDHPFGSGRGRHHSKVKVARRFAPPGRKVGKIRARKTGTGKTKEIIS